MINYEKIFVIIFAVAVLTAGCGNISALIDQIDKQYSDAIPTISYNGDYLFNKRIYAMYAGSKQCTIYASYPEGIEQIINSSDLDVMEQSIASNWKPYSKKNNEVIISLKIDNVGNKEYEFLGNTGI